MKCLPLAPHTSEVMYTFHLQFYVMAQLFANDEEYDTVSFGASWDLGSTQPRPSRARTNAERTGRGGWCPALVME